MKKIITIILVIMFTLTTISSCKNKKINDIEIPNDGVSKISNEGNNKIENYFIPQKINMLNSNEYLFSVDVSKKLDEQIWNVGRIECENKQNYFKFNLATNEKNIINIEKEIDDGESKIFDDKIYTISSEKETDGQNYYYINVFDTNGEKVKSIKTININNNIFDYCIDKNSNVYILYSIVSVNKMAILKINSTGETERSVIVDEKLSEDIKSEYYGCITVDEEGEVYITGYSYELNNKSIKDTKIYFFDTDLGYINYVKNTTLENCNKIFTLGNKIYTSYKSNDTGSPILVDVIDTSKKEIINRYELIDVDKILKGDEKFQVYYTKKNILYGYNFDSEVEELINAGVTVQEINEFSILGDNILYASSEDFSGYYCKILNEVGEVITEYQLNSTSNGGTENFTINEDKTITCHEYDKGDFGRTNDFINTYDENGEKISSVPISDSINYTYFKSIYKYNDGNIFLCYTNYESDIDESYIAVLDKEGTVSFQYKVTGVCDVIKEKEGNMILTHEDGKMSKFDYANKTIIEDFKLSNFKYTYGTILYEGNQDFWFFFLSSGVLYGYDGENIHEIIDYFDSDLEGNINFLSLIDNDNLLAYIEENNKEPFFCILKRASEEELNKIQNKKIIKVAFVDSSYFFSEQIADFNKNNKDYKVKLVDYKAGQILTGNITEDMVSISSKINNEILMGNVPDIIIGEKNLFNLEIFKNKNLIADLNEFIKNDKDIKREDYLENILKSLEQDGKLYELAPFFYLESLISKTSLAGIEEGWNTKEFMKFVEENKEKIFFGNTSKDVIFEKFLNLSLLNYIDYKTGKCSFNSPEFINLLKFINQYVKSVEEPSEQEKYYYVKENYYEEPMFFDIISTYNYFHINENGNVGEPITCKGVPSLDKGGCAINYNYSFSIFEKSKNKEGAWEFIKTFLTDEYQDVYREEFPIKKSSLEKIKQLEKKGELDENRKNINKVYKNGKEINLGIPSDESIEKVDKLLHSVNKSVLVDLNISRIINEEVNSFFSGDKTAEEVADLIQNRVNTYINEIK